MTKDCHLATGLIILPLMRILSISSVSLIILWHKLQRVFSSCCTLVLARDAGGFQCLMSSLILITINNDGRYNGLHPLNQYAQCVEQDAEKDFAIYPIIIHTVWAWSWFVVVNYRSAALISFKATSLAK